ncbi:tripartite tricarboxylate transporter substrate binding protein [Comamonadaceae bacterium PP-2]
MIAAHARRLALAVALTHTVPVALAQEAWPSRPVHINVGASPGGGTDRVARLLAERLGSLLGQSVIVDNRPGAANTIAADLTARAPADGYTLLVATNSPQVIAPHLMKLGFDPLRQLTPIGMVMVVPHVLIVPDSSGFQDVGGLLAELKARPEGLRYASSGIGSVQHMAGELFMAATGTRLVHVPYKGSAQAHQDILSGQVELMLDTSSSALALIKSGKFRALAVTTAQRSDELPHVPTLDELGINGAEMSTWYALYAPAATPSPVLERLERMLDTTLRSPTMQVHLKAMGGSPSTLSREQFIVRQSADFDRFGVLIRQRHLTLD